MVYAIASSIERGSPVDRVARVCRGRLLLHWVGTDVLWARRAWERGTASRRLLNAEHWADAPWLVDELRPLGIAARVQQLPGDFSFGDTAPMPAEFRVLIYLPRNPHEAYDVAGTLEVVRALPDVGFSIVGGFELPQPLANAEALGYRKDMDAVYRQHSALLRLVAHDGMSISVLEALSYGRRVGWSYPLEGVDQVPSAEVAIEVVRAWSEAHAAGGLAPQAAVAERVRAMYEPGRVLEEVSAVLEELVR